MGRSKWRNRDRRPQTQTPNLKLQVRATVQRIPACPGAERPGFDPDVLSALHGVNALINDMRLDIYVPPVITDADTAVRRYLVHLSLLIDVMLGDILLSVLHSTDVAVRIKRRMLLEYCAKGLYCFDHPDYCLDFTTTLESKSVLGKLKNGGQPAEDIEVETKHLESQLERFPPQYTEPIPFSRIFRHYTRPADSETNNEYVGLYRLPSAYIHGDPEGMRYLMPLNEHGHTAPTISVSDDELNAMMVDVGANILVFCDIFIATFKPSDESLTKRSEDLDLVFKVLSLKHPYGRPEEGMKVLKAELEAARAAGRIP
jgi:hypothetical protein